MKIQYRMKNNDGKFLVTNIQHFYKLVSMILVNQRSIFNGLKEIKEHPEKFKFFKKLFLSRCFSEINLMNSTVLE